ERQLKIGRVERRDSAGSPEGPPTPSVWQRDAQTVRLEDHPSAPTSAAGTVRASVARPAVAARVRQRARALCIASSSAGLRTCAAASGASPRIAPKHPMIAAPASGSPVSSAAISATYVAALATIVVI